MAKQKLVVFGLLGTQLDIGKGTERWHRWRPSISIFRQEDTFVHRFHFIYSARFASMAATVKTDTGNVRPFIRFHL
jgi:transcriptional regulatory protein RtcR